MLTQTAAPRLVVHLVRRIGPDELDGGVLGLIRHMPPGRYRHAVICLSRRAGDRHDPCVPGLAGVEVIGLGAADGPAAGYLGIFRLLRRLQPDLVHTRTLDCQLLAALAGVKWRVHGEPAGASAHGLGGRIMRLLFRPLVGHFITANAELRSWLIERVGAPPQRVSQIHRGVDSISFHPRLAPPSALGPAGFMADGALVVGSAGRIDDTVLAEAFLRLTGMGGHWQKRLRLVLLGDGPGRLPSHELLVRAGLGQRCWLPGWRPGLAPAMRSMDIFVAGNDNTHVLEAMASGLAIVGPNVPAMTALLHSGSSGLLVQPNDAIGLADALETMCMRPDLARQYGVAARRRVIERFSLPVVAGNYLAVYDAVAGIRQPEVQL
jgi:glycosyltransferase involved in cell wall biosynthesis